MKETQPDNQERGTVPLGLKNTANTSRVEGNLEEYFRLCHN